MDTFEQYLKQYQIDPVRLAATAKVRYLIVYKAQKGLPIQPENAQKIREAVLRLSSVPYVGSFVLTQELNTEALALQFSRIPGPRHHL
jgi:hypothetical protein